MPGSAYSSDIVIDLEFTPTNGRNRHWRNSRPAAGSMADKALADKLEFEIVEIGAVRVDARGNAIDEFSRVVKPTIARGVSGFVNQLTGIRDEELTDALPLSAVLDEFRQWAGPGARMVAWSKSDQLQIACECGVKGIDTNGLPSRWMDIQRLYPRLMGLPKRSVALGEAADWCGIEFDRYRAHRALYDARKTAELFGLMHDCGLRTQRKAIESQVSDGSESESLSSNVGSRCSGLAELLDSLRLQEAV